MEAAGITPGERVVITAAAGGLGSILVQLAKSAGAHVIALAGGRTKLDHAKSLGADTAVDYRAHDWAAHLRAVSEGRIDVVFDGVGADVTSVLFPLVRPGGRYLSHGAAGGRWGAIDEDAAKESGVTLIGLADVGAGSMFELTERALDLAARGAIRPTIGQVFPLDRAEAAHAAMELRAVIGKTLLVLSESAGPL